jgi:hypothetical protein
VVEAVGVKLVVAVCPDAKATVTLTWAPIGAVPTEMFTVAVPLASVVPLVVALPLANAAVTTKLVLAGPVTVSDTIDPCSGVVDERVAETAPVEAEGDAEALAEALALGEGLAVPDPLSLRTVEPETQPPRRASRQSMGAMYLKIT